MKTIELIKIISECKTGEQLLALQKLCPGYNVGFNFETKQAYVKKDIRIAIKNKLAEEGLSVNQFSKDIDYDYSNFKNFLSGKRSIPFEILERIFGILQL